MPPKLANELRDAVRERAQFLCEYCHTDERWQLIQFTIDHVRPLTEGGTDDHENLALACFHCNRRKSNKQILIDSITGKAVSIFDPRMMVWKDHFGWSADHLKIISKSAIGTVTIDLLILNRPRILQIRQDDKMVDRHPPPSDFEAPE